MQSFSDNPALRSHLESQVNFMNEFTQKMVDTLRQLSEMNLKLTRQAIEGSLYASREMLSCTDPMQFAQVAMKQIEPATERLRAYQQHMLGVLAGAQADFTRAAESRVPEASRSASAVADEMVRNASSAVSVPVTGPGRTPNGPAGSPSPGSPASGNGSANDQPHNP
jgi:phasin family protein